MAEEPACAARLVRRRGRATRRMRLYGNWRCVKMYLHSMAGDGKLGACAMIGTALNVVSFLFFGFFLGMRRATDADHVVAIARIVSRERRLAGSALISAARSVGHTIVEDTLC